MTPAKQATLIVIEVMNTVCPVTNTGATTDTLNTVVKRNVMIPSVYIFELLESNRSP